MGRLQGPNLGDVIMGMPAGQNVGQMPAQQRPPIQPDVVPSQTDSQPTEGVQGLQGLPELQYQGENYMPMAGLRAHSEEIGRQQNMWDSLMQMGLANKGGKASPLMAFLGGLKGGKLGREQEGVKKQIYSAEDEMQKAKLNKDKAHFEYKMKMKPIIAKEINKLFDGNKGNDDEALSHLNQLSQRLQQDIGEDFGISDVVGRWMKQYGIEAKLQMAQEQTLTQQNKQNSVQNQVNTLTKALNGLVWKDADGNIKARPGQEQAVNAIYSKLQQLTQGIDEESIDPVVTQRITELRNTMSDPEIAKALRAKHINPSLYGVKEQ